MICHCVLARANSMTSCWYLGWAHENELALQIRERVCFFISLFSKELAYQDTLDYTNRSQHKWVGREVDRSWASWEAVEIVETRASSDLTQGVRENENNENRFQKMDREKIQHDLRGKSQQMIHILNLMGDKMVVPFLKTGKSEEELVSGVDVSVAFGGRIIHLITN